MVPQCVAGQKPRIGAAVSTGSRSLRHPETALRRVGDPEELLARVLPLEIYPISAGVKGGLAGGAAMAFLRSCTDW